MKNFGNKNPENYKPQAEKTAVNEQVKETQTLVATLGIDIEKQMTQGKREKVKTIIKSVVEKIKTGEITSKADLEAKGYQQIKLIRTRNGFLIDEIFDLETGEVKWGATSIPTYIHNFLNKEDVVLGKFKDDPEPDSDPSKIAIYTKEKKV